MEIRNFSNLKDLKRIFFVHFPYATQDATYERKSQMMFPLTRMNVNDSFENI